MASRRRDLRSYVDYIKHVCPQLPKLSTLVRKLRSPKTGFGDHSITFPICCTDNLPNSDGVPQVCQIFEELPLWNELLWFVTAELREVSPGRLAVTRLRNVSVPPNMCQQVEGATICLHWLLAEHQCIDSVEVDSKVLHTYPQLFCDALQLSKSLKTLRLSGRELDVYTAAGLITAICKTRHLEQLECDDLRLFGDVKRLQACIADFISNTTLLKTLRLTRLRNLRDVQVLTRALHSNSNLSKLTVDAPFVTSENRIAFSNFLANNSVLKELTVVAPSDVDTLFKALAGNSVLRKLSLETYIFSLAETTALSAMLAANTSIEEVNFPYCEWNFLAPWPWQNKAGQLEVQSAWIKWGRWWRVEPFAHAIRSSTSLRKLAFGMNPFLDDEMRRLLAAVKESSSLRELNFRLLTLQSVDEFCNLLQETGTLEKVTITECCSNSVFLADSLRRLPELPSIGQHSFYDLHPLHLQDLCTVLASRDAVTALDLYVDKRTGIVDEQCATFLATYLASTTVLKEIQMRFYAPSEAVYIVISGLSGNKSLETLGIEGWHLDDDNVRQLCKCIQQSRTLHRLVWLCMGSHTASSMMAELSERLQNSYALTYLRTNEFRENEEKWQVVKSLLRRNSSLVERAAHFALGSTLKRCATAFELVWWHPLVLARVQELASVSAVEAHQKLAESGRRLHDDFWQLSYIINKQFSCHDRDDDEVQIDELGFYSLLNLSSFLSVADVKDSPPKRRRGRKRKASV